jgi:hypothetical protein
LVDAGLPLAVVDVLVAGSARTYADAGLPPRVSASADRSAYGTLIIRMRGCSLSPARSTCTPSQRACPEAKTSMGNPSGFVELRTTVYSPPLAIVMFCASCQSAVPPVSSP